MTWHIICLAGPTDSYAPDLAPGDGLLYVPYDIPNHPDAVQTSLPDVFATHGIDPTTAAHDLLKAAIGAYTGDIRIDRSRAYDGWTRDLALHLPVHEFSRWTSRGAPRLTNLLSFLTGDHWQVLVRPVPAGYQPVRGQVQGVPVRVETDTVCLFSGGLDSYIGAVDALAAGGQVALVGHYAAGQGPTSSAQRQTLAAMAMAYPIDKMPFLKCWVSPPKGPQRATEMTTRGRSILFLALGIAVASGLASARLLVPENGFISLNVPLTPPRSGSLSTRTTHPHLIAQVRALLEDLGIEVAVELPYRFSTKGEMIVACSNQEVLLRGLPITMSCSHPGVGRFIRGGSANQHCGYCLPCLVRRAGVSTWGADPTRYTWRDLSGYLSPSRRADLRALRLALQRHSQRPPVLADILVSGPLPGTSEDLDAYLGVYRRGLRELQQFVDNFARES